MATDNPYPFDNDAYQRAAVSLRYYVNTLWLAGASVQQIESTVDEATGQLPEDGIIAQEPTEAGQPPAEDVAPEGADDNAPSGVAEERADPENDARAPSDADADPAPNDEVWAEVDNSAPEDTEDTRTSELG